MTDENDIVDEEARDQADEGQEESQEEARPSLNLDVKIDKPGACQRHITVTVSKEDVDRYFDDAVGELLPDAQVPGFRPGKAPKALVETRFRKQVASQVKGALLMDTLEQVSKESSLAPISEPQVDFEAIDIEKGAPMTFEFDLEVRPEFELPQWKGLTIRKPVRDFTDADVNHRLEGLIGKYGRMVAKEGAAERGDYVTVNLRFRHNGEAVSEHEEVDIRVRPLLIFVDATMPGFDQLMVGAKAGDVKTAKVRLSEEAAEESLRGQEVDVEFEVVEVRRLELPALNEKILEQLGGFTDEVQLREAVLRSLESNLTYHQQREVREQITSLLTESANWDLPPELVRRQMHRERDRMIMELQSRGFTEADIRARENELRQNIMAVTRQMLREHFILEKLAEMESIDATSNEIDAAIDAIAQQRGESSRRVRARLERRGAVDALRNQIIESKVIDLIEQHATFEEAPFEMPEQQHEAVDVAIAGEAEEQIPEAKYSDDASLRDRETAERR